MTLRSEGILALTLAMAGMMPTQRMTEIERMINNMTLSEVATEYNLILEKKSGFTKSQRDTLISVIKNLIRQGHLFESEDGKVSSFIEIK